VLTFLSLLIPYPLSQDRLDFYVSIALEQYSQIIFLANSFFICPLSLNIPFLYFYLSTHLFIKIFLILKNLKNFEESCGKNIHANYQV